MSLPKAFSISVCVSGIFAVMKMWLNGVCSSIKRKPIVLACICDCIETLPPKWKIHVFQTYWSRCVLAEDSWNVNAMILIFIQFETTFMSIKLWFEFSTSTMNTESTLQVYNGTAFVEAMFIEREMHGFGIANIITHVGEQPPKRTITSECVSYIQTNRRLKKIILS